MTLGRSRWLLALRHAVYQVAASIYCHQRQFITVRRLEGAETSIPEDSATIAVMVDSLPAFRALAAEIPRTFRDSLEALEERVAHGCVLCLARRKRADGAGHEVIGYEIAERGVFSALGRRTPAAADVIFSHYAEVLPAHRGRRVHRLLFLTRDAYFRARGARLLCGVVDPDNAASLRALVRAGHVVVGTVERVAIFRWLVVRRTPREAIDRALRGA